MMHKTVQHTSPLLIINFIASTTFISTEGKAKIPKYAATITKIAMHLKLTEALRHYSYGFSRIDIMSGVHR